MPDTSLRAQCCGILLGLFSLLVMPVVAQEHPLPEEGDFTIQAFAFDDGSVLDLTQHYTTIGTPQRDAEGRVNNAVLIMHGTTGSGSGFFSENFAGVLFGPGQLLDASRFFIILPDAIGHGQSSKPSDGLRATFPRYTYGDMVRAQYELLTEHLQVDHLRLVTGTSMGGMMSWVYGYTYPDFMDALLPLASLPVEIAGRNRMTRKMMIDAVTQDPAWQEGNYEEQPPGLKAAMYALVFMVSSPLQYQQMAPTRETSETLMDDLVERYRSRIDANDLIYAFDASRFYNPAPHLDKITAPLIAINSADDQVNPPELGILERETARIPGARAIVLPITEMTRGHGTHSRPSIWGPYLAGLLAATSVEVVPGPDMDLLVNPQDPAWDSIAPDHYRARFTTTEGAFTVQVERAWAPHGADRFYQLVKNGFYNGVHINRVVPGFIAQFGLSPEPRVTAAWKSAVITDDPVQAGNTPGRIAFAMTGPDTRSTQVYINLGDNSRLDADGFSPFGEVVEGMDVVNRLYGLYGENAGGGMRGGRQGLIEAGGADYLLEQYPLLDYIISAEIEVLAGPGSGLAL
ncbi:homoserine acetyltransferase [Kineobactrum sediminis]|uniref:Homoserine acetyltransferase n=1 Tax=Kineobactrum sediminis TaxID=1905677 RepID=A0A2N5XZA2_9GAMM|nr:alpha/beta fold hydrolase [Kineobactrum sediminis]PLW81470.1 homoserine acetyltransferase [Kineobactrum sediminis]